MMFDFLQSLFGFNSAGTPNFDVPVQAVPEWVMLDETLQVRWNAPPPQPRQEPLSTEVAKANSPRLNAPPVLDDGQVPTDTLMGYKTPEPPDEPPYPPPAQGKATKTASRPERAKPGSWTQTDQQWLSLSAFQKAAAMSLMEADGARPEDAKNALAAMLNRAAKNNVDLGSHVSSRLYQPTFEPAQHARLSSILKNPHFTQLTKWAERYQAGQEADPTNGATHFLAHPSTMLALEAREPWKYRSWRQWTGFDAVSRTYRNQTIADRSHAFLAPEGRFSLGAR